MENMKLHPSLLMLLCLFGHGLVGKVCTVSPEGNASVSSSPPHGSSPPHQVKKECDALSLESQQAIAGAVAKLGLKLLENLQPGPEQPNVVLSPLSVSLALAQLALGAVNKTEEHLLGALHASLLPDYYQTLSCLQEQLIAKAIKVASRIYLKPDFVLKKDFVEKSLQLFKSEPTPLTSVEEVNQWVEAATNGHINNFLSSLPPSVVLMLINAVHFKGEWTSRFDSRYTAKDLFYIDKQTAVKVDMMTGSKYPLSMFVDVEQGTKVARFPFKENTSFLVVMPTPSQNLSRAAANLNITDLYERLPSETTMLVKLPKIKLEYKQDLQSALTKMGLGSLFSGPDLSGIAVGPLVVSGVQHASNIELNEEGAEASATTSVILVRTVPTFAVNMPFIFAIVDDVSHMPLFVGTVTNPNPGATVELSDDPEIMRPSSSNIPTDAPQGDDPYWDNMLHDASDECEETERLLKH
ncbi:alpha-2-antiplasmin [Colossoma macropomum]|uniref:alpha-2-antiplasmin n=1 Tax=Colossoma macropomum TaxID=42526 RepID=UPI001864F230|nr:alpha-2-antiplasmin [Colossoma macropomum]